MAFITRDTNRLKLSGVDWRCAGWGLPRLALDWGTAWNSTTGVFYPSQFYVDDCLQTAVELGANWVRLHGSCSPTMGSALTVFPDGINLNTTATDKIDYVIYKASLLGLRLQITLVDVYTFFWGGTALWSTTFGGSGSDFFTNSSVIDPFKTAVSAFLNHTNIYNGLKYLQDETIFSWCLTNEGNAPDSWITNLAAYVKGIAPNQLVQDGRDLFSISASSLANANVDIVGNHGYDAKMTDTQVNADIATVAGAKVLIYGEYDLNRVRAAGGEDTLVDFYAAVEAGWPSIWSDAPWALAGHGDTYGAETNYDDYSGSGNDDGFDSLAFYADKRDALIAARNHNYAMRGISVPAAAVCSPPANLGGRLYWRGSAAADTYTIEQSSTASGGYASHTTGQRDSDTPVALPANKYYRVRAVNLDGVSSSPSQSVFLESFALVAHTVAASAAGNGFTTSAIDTSGADLIVLSIGYYNGINTATVSDSKSNTWTALTQRVATNNCAHRLFYCASPTVGTGHTFTLTGNSTFGAMQVQAFSGAAASPYVSENGATAGSGTSLQTGSLTPAENNALLVSGACIREAANPGDTLSINSSFSISDSQIGVASQNLGSAMAYKIQEARGAENPTWSWQNTDQVATGIAVFNSIGAVAVVSANGQLGFFGVGA